MSYHDFLAGKSRVFRGSGFKPESVPDSLFPFQRRVVEWASAKGRSAIFADCGMGKTAMQLAWASNASRRSLILAPLAVSGQTVREATKFGIRAKVVEDDSDVEDGCVSVTNYEKLHRIDPERFGAVVLDESSILKSYDGKTRTAIIEAFRATPRKLACTATPAPNDWMELGNHAEFLGVMSRVEMLSRYFVHDGGKTQDWRLKGHARRDFWRWVCSWAVAMRSPADIGFGDDGYTLPEIRYVEHIVGEDVAVPGMLFRDTSLGLMDRRRARRSSLDERVAIVAKIVNESPEPWLVWCDLNDESDALAKAIPDAVEVAGRHSADEKVAAMDGFTSGAIRVLVTKPSIAGWGMNWQHCARVVFCGQSDSYEQRYQAIRRVYRFDQARPVEIHTVTGVAERDTSENIQRKHEAADAMAAAMVETMKQEGMNMDESAHRGDSGSAMRTSETGDGWTMVNGDSVEVLQSLESDSVGFSVFSPPFASLYTYSESDRDMGNCTDHEEFFEHFRFLIEQLHRVTMPGRSVSFHCMNLPTSKVRDGMIGLTDFRGELIRAFADAGFIYHSEVCIWKDPVTAMQRTKALGLLHKTIRKDSSMSRQGIPDYLVTMRKPGENPIPISHSSEDYPVDYWQKVASPVWMDINPSDTLQKESAREDADEKHICPLQLTVIRRALELWSAPGDLVLSPFAGIGSEGYESIRTGRRFFGVELKRSYYEQAVANLRRVVVESSQDLFSGQSASARIR